MSNVAREERGDGGEEGKGSPRLVEVMAERSRSDSGGTVCREGSRAAVYVISIVVGKIVRVGAVYK